MQHDDDSAQSLSAAHPGPCRRGPLGPLVHLRCPLWALDLGGFSVSSNSKNTKIVKELDHCSCSSDSAASERGVFITSEDVLNHSLAGAWGWGRAVFKLAPLLEAERAGSEPCTGAATGNQRLARSCCESLCEPALRYVQRTVMI